MGPYPPPFCVKTEGEDKGNDGPSVTWGLNWSILARSGQILSAPLDHLDARAPARRYADRP